VGGGGVGKRNSDGGTHEQKGQLNTKKGGEDWKGTQGSIKPEKTFTKKKQTRSPPKKKEADSKGFNHVGKRRLESKVLQVDCRRKKLRTQEKKKAVGGDLGPLKRV